MDCPVFLFIYRPVHFLRSTTKRRPPLTDDAGCRPGPKVFWYRGDEQDGCCVKCCDRYDKIILYAIDNDRVITDRDTTVESATYLGTRTHPHVYTEWLTNVQYRSYCKIISCNISTNMHSRLESRTDRQNFYDPVNSIKTGFLVSLNIICISLVVL